MQDEPLAAKSANEGQRLAQNDEGEVGAVVEQAPLAAGERWELAQAKARAARSRTEYLLRENPIPTVVGALAIGLAIGWALRHATTREEKEIEVRSPLGNLNLSFLSLPFLWPFFKSIREKYEDSAEVVKDRVGRIKKIDVDSYTKPIRKRWRAWTD